MMLPWIMLAIMIAIGGLISIIWTVVDLYNSNHNKTGTLVLIFGLLGVGKPINNLQVVRVNTRES
jgi:hypothetical protein